MCFQIIFLFIKKKSVRVKKNLFDPPLSNQYQMRQNLSHDVIWISASRSVNICLYNDVGIKATTNLLARVILMYLYTLVHSRISDTSFCSLVFLITFCFTSMMSKQIFPVLLLFVGVTLQRSPIIRADFVDFRALAPDGIDCTVQDPGLASTSRRLGQSAISSAATRHQTTSIAGPQKPLCSSIKPSQMLKMMRKIATAAIAPVTQTATGDAT